MPEPEPALDFWTWVRHHLLLSNSRQAWEGRLALLVLLLGGGGILWLGGELPLSRQVLLWGGLFVVLAVLLRQGWLRLFGPVLFYDLVRVSRRGRYFLMRLLYVMGLCLLLCLFYWRFWVEMQYMADANSLKKQAEFAENFFYTFMWVQFLAVVVLTPAYTASAIAEEKERKTLEFLLATDLHNREIILGKWLARVGNLALLVLSGIPILALNLFMGGVDPDLMVAGFVATGLTMFGLASVSILASVYSKRTRDAIVLSYLTFAAYYTLSTMLTIFAMAYPAFGSQGIYLGDWSLTVLDVSHWLATGNIFVVLFNLMRGLWGGGGGVANILPSLLREYAFFHGLLALGAVALAVGRLRIVAIKEQTVKAFKRGPRLRTRSGVGNYPPMVWKEVFADAGQRLNVAGNVILLLLVALSFVPLIIIVYYYLESNFKGWGAWRGNWDEFSRAVNYWSAITGMLVACLTLLGVGVRAAGAISGERDKQTFDSLLTTPLTSNELLWAKWLGSLTGLRWGFVWVCLIWVIGAATASLHPLLLVALVAAWAIYAGVIALIGLWFSAVSKTSLRATLWTVVTTLGVTVGHWFLWMCCMPLFAFSGNPGPASEEVIQVLLKTEMGLSPPVALYAMLPWRADELTTAPPWYSKDFPPASLIAYAVFGMAVWALTGAFLWVGLSKRFQQLTGREPRTPERRQPRPRPDTEGRLPEGGS